VTANHTKDIFGKNGPNSPYYEEKKVGIARFRP
jgi:hypothetical protein